MHAADIVITQQDSFATESQREQLLYHNPTMPQPQRDLAGKTDQL